MRRGDNDEDYWQYDLFDIKIADFEETDDQIKYDNDTKTL